MMRHTKYSCRQSAFRISENHLFTACILPQRGNISVEKNIIKRRSRSVGMYGANLMSGTMRSLERSQQIPNLFYPQNVPLENETV